MHKHNSKHNSHVTHSPYEQVAELAYSFFVIEGRQNGHDLEHWLRAEDVLSKARSSGNKA
jgi:Zn-dependent M16 (insulinase) family peptidase